MRALVFLGLALSFAGCGACEPTPSAPDAAPGTSASASASAHASASPSASALPRAVKTPRAACRNVTVDGDVRVVVEGEGDAAAAPVPLLLQGLAPLEGWINLAPGSRLIVKDPRTARETTFKGPGKARACVDLVEESWVAAGTFGSNVGAGEGPGAEEWAATPLGVFRYTAARLDVVVTPGAVTATLASGAAFVWVADDASGRAAAGAGDAGGERGEREDGWTRLEVGALTLKPLAPQTPPVDAARVAATRCMALGKTAGDLAGAILAGAADGGTIVTQVATRREARAACAVAGVRAALLPRSEAASAISKTVADGLGAINASPP